MAYPQMSAAVWSYLARYDSTRFLPGIDSIPTDSVTLLETNPRFVAALLAGVNHEMNRELLWRNFPTDRRGTPFRKFWSRLDGKLDINEMHTWSVAGLTKQTVDGKAKIVLLVRGELLRRYPNTIVVAIKAVDDHTPSMVPAETLVPIFFGQFDPDVTFYGFDLEDTDLLAGAGWFFALMEPITEPRFGFDETIDATRAQLTAWNDAAWPDLASVAPGGHVTVAALNALPLPDIGRSDGVAQALFQQPFELLVHAKHLFNA
jgi:hypothetical protein